MSTQSSHELLAAQSDAVIGDTVAGREVNTNGDPLLRTYSSDKNHVLLIGQCLATETELARAADQAQASGVIQPLTELAGSYSGVMSTEHGTTVFGDLAGQFPLYYRFSKDGLALSTSARQLAHEYNEDIDRASVAADVWQGMEYLNQGYSYFHNIHKLAGGQALQISERGISRRTYETFAARADLDFSIAAEMTRQRLTDAIQRRLDNTERLTSDFSGGHDSTSLAMLAASLSDEPIPSLVHYNKAYPAGDIEHARRLAKLHPGILLQELVDGPEEIPYVTLEPGNIPYFGDAPFRLTDTIGLERRRRRTAEENGSTLHLLGVGGDALYDGFPALADLLRQGETDKAWGQAILLARLSLNSSPQQWIDSAGRERDIRLSQAYAAIADVCREPAKRLSYSTGWLYQPTANLQWLTPEMRRLLAARAEAQAEQADQQISRGEYSTLQGIYNNGDAHLHARQLGGPMYHAPFLDHQVVRAATQLDLFERAPIGSFKPLLRAALAGHGVPAEVFQRTSKGNYSPVADAGLRRAAGAILKLVDSSRLAAMDIIDPRAVRRSIEEFGLTNERVYVEAFVAAEVWARQRELFKESGTVELQPASPPAAIKEAAADPEVAEILAQRYAISPHMTFVSGPVQMVALNVRTGIYATLNQTAIRILQTMASGDALAAIQSLAIQFPNADPEQLRSDVAGAIKSFKEQGIIIDPSTSPGAAPAELPEWPAPNSDHSPNIETHRVRPLHPTEQFVFSDAEKTQGHEALRQAYALGEEGLAATIRFLEEVSRTEGRQADSETVQRDLVNIRRLSLDSSHNNQRIACYESSLAAVLLAAQRGQRITWCIGVAFRPGPMLHAWVEVDGKPVTISTDEQVEGVYETLLRF